MKPAATRHRTHFCIVLWFAVATLGGCGHAAGPSATAHAGDAVGAALAVPAYKVRPTGSAALLQFRLELIPGIGAIRLSETETDQFSIELTLDRRVRRLRSALNAASCAADADWLLHHGGATGHGARLNPLPRRGI